MLATSIPDSAVPVAQILEDMLRERLRDDKVKLPPYPAVATKLQATVSTDTYSLHDIVKIVSSDASLSATVLRHASSAAMGATQAVQSLETAIQKLGEREVVRLAFTQSVGQASGVPGSLAVLRRSQWRASLTSATLCQGLAARRGLRPEVAFLAGLLHDFGSVVALVGLEELAASQKVAGLPAEAWGQIVQNLHIDFGVLIATRWRLPTALADVIATHHHPEACLKQNRPLVDLVALVDQVLEALEQSAVHDADLFASIPSLDPGDRAQIMTLLAAIEETMKGYEGMFPPTPVKAETPSRVVAPVSSDGSWPVDFPVTVISDEAARLRASALSFKAIGIHGKKALAVNALTRVRLDCDPPIAMLVTVKTCEPTADGEHIMSVQPFGLDGPAKPAWLKLLADTRPGGAADVPRPAPAPAYVPASGGTSVGPPRRNFTVPAHKRLNF